LIRAPKLRLQPFSLWEKVATCAEAQKETGPDEGIAASACVEFAPHPQPYPLPVLKRATFSQREKEDRECPDFYLQHDSESG